jgi:hypothetical protein
VVVVVPQEEEAVVEADVASLLPSVMRMTTMST